MSADALDVQIVGEPWTGDLLAILAIVVSVATLVWSLWARRRDQAHLTISSALSLPVGFGAPGERLISVDVTNAGRTGPTVLQNISLRNGKRGGTLWIHSPAYGVGPSYPATLAPGETAQLLINPEGVASACVDHNIDPDHLWVVAKGGHGETLARLRANCRWLVRDVSGGRL